MKIGLSEYTFEAPISKDLKFVFVSDLHGFSNKKIMDKIIKLKPDGILVGGDFIHSDMLCKMGFEFLQIAAQMAPTFCVLGNHEGAYSGDIRSKIKGTGARLLDNDWAEFKGVVLGGLTSGIYYYSQNKMPKVDWLLEFSDLKRYKILLCHHPEYYEKYIKDLNIDLILSGHAHGGQWRIFSQGLFAPGQGIFPKYTGGCYDRRLIVSRGLGNVSPIPKINNPPEIVIINLKESIKNK